MPLPPSRVPPKPRKPHPISVMVEKMKPGTWKIVGKKKPGFLSKVKTILLHPESYCKNRGIEANVLVSKRGNVMVWRF